MRAIALSSLMLVAGCRDIAARVFSAPTVRLESVRVAALGLEGAAVEVGLSILNPNHYSLTARSGSYRLLANGGVEVGHGALTQSFMVPAGQRDTVQLPLTVSWNALGSAMQGAANTGVIDYQVIGEVVADTPIGERRIPLSAKGQFAPLRMIR